MRPPFIVDNTESLDVFLRDWLPSVRDQRVALDLEEDRMLRYAPQIALIQITLPDDDTTDVIVDPVRLGLEALKPVIETLSTSGEVIMHGSRNDIVGLKRDFNIAPAELRDTQIAARFLGSKRFGLAPMLEDRFDVTLSKSARRSNWLGRPLTESQIRYARLDTHYLCRLFGELEEQLHESGWYDAFEEECRVLTDLPADTTEFDPFGWQRIKSTRKLPEQSQQYAAAIWHWRDEYSYQHNLHPNLTLPSWAVEEIAKRGPDAIEHGKISRIFANLDSEAIHDAREALAEAGNLPTRRPRNPNDRASGRSVDPETSNRRFQALRTWREQTAESLGFDRGWLTPNDQLEAMSKLTDPSVEALRELESVREWQISRFTDDWLKILRSF